MIPFHLHAPKIVRQSAINYCSSDRNNYYSCICCPLQVIYPDTVAEMEAGGWRDEDLAAVLDTVSLGHILTREGGWDAAADWKVTIITVSCNYLHYLFIYFCE